MKTALLAICLLACLVPCYAVASMDSILRVLNSFKSLLEVTPRESYLTTGHRHLRFNQNEFENLIDAGNLDNLDQYLRDCGGLENVEVDETAALIKATQGGHLEIFKYLISQGLSVDANFTQEQHDLYLAMLKLPHGPVREEFLLILYANSRALFTEIYEPRLEASRSEDGQFTDWQSGVINQAMQENDFLYIKWLIEERGARADCDFGRMGSFIHAAIIMDCNSSIKILLQHGADPNARFPMEISYYNHHNELLQLHGFTPLMLAVWVESLEIANDLLKDPRTEVTKGLHTNQFENPRAIARRITDEGIRTEFLKLLHARPADAPRLAKWIDEVDLAELDMEMALSSGKQGFVEFLLHNVHDIEFHSSWLNYPQFQHIISIEFGQI